MKDLNKLNINELKKELDILDKQKNKITKKEVGVWIIGENYFIRTVTMAVLGKLKQVTNNEFVLSEASWIADTGRFSDFLKGKYSDDLEVEPFPNEVIIGRNSLIDAVVWNNDLLRDKK